MADATTNVSKLRTLRSSRLRNYRQSSFECSNFFSLPRELRDIIYDMIIANTLPLFIGGTKRTRSSTEGRDLPHQQSKSVAKLYWKYLTLPKNDNDAEHVYFRPGQDLQSFLDAQDRLYDEFSTRIYDAYTFRVVIRLNLHRSQPLLRVNPKNPGITCSGWRLLEWWEPQLHLLSIPAQLPSLAVMQRIKHLRMEVLLYGQPHLGFADLASMVNLRRLTLSFVGHGGRLCTPHQHWSSKWDILAFTQGVDHEYWQAFLVDLLQHMPRSAEIYLDESSPIFGDEDCAGMTIGSMRKWVTVILMSQGRKLAI